MSFLTEKYISILHSAKKHNTLMTFCLVPTILKIIFFRCKWFKIKCSKMMFNLRHELIRENSITAINVLQLFACPSGTWPYVSRYIGKYFYSLFAKYTVSVIMSDRRNIG